MHVFLAMSERLFFNKEKVKEKKSVSTCCNTQNLKQTDMYDSTPPPSPALMFISLCVHGCALGFHAICPVSLFDTINFTLR